MSNLSAHRPADYRLESFLPKDLGWEEESLFSSASRGRQYGETDWTDVPKIDYSSGEFTQLSIPEPAEIVEESGDFVLDDLDSLRQMGKKGLGGEEESNNSLSQSKQIRQARALTLELVKTKYQVKDLGQSERLARAKLKNPEAHSNADQPFIPTYGESRRALLRKLGFSDDYELSLSGKAKPDQGRKNKDESTDESIEDTSPQSLASRESSERSKSSKSSLGSKDSQDFENQDASSLEQAIGGRVKNSAEGEGEGENTLESDEVSQHFEALAHDAADVVTLDGVQGEAGVLTPSGFETPDVSADEAKLAAQKAFEEGYQKGLSEAKEKALVQESLQAEIALKEEQKRDEAQKAKDAQAQMQREKERKEYENEIQNLKDKIKSFDESLLGELEKKKEQLDQEMAPKVKVLTELCDQLKALTEDSQSFFEPLKRLSVHIAEQLVLGELSMSPQVVERLIQRCIDELDMRDTPIVKVELNPLDKALLESAAGSNLERLKVSVGQNMQVGSVRVSVNDTQIEDLIQNRLETIATRLLGQPLEWRDQSDLMNKVREKSYFEESKEVDDLPRKKNSADSKDSKDSKDSSTRSEVLRATPADIKAETRDETRAETKAHDSIDEDDISESSLSDVQNEVDAHSLNETRGRGLDDDLNDVSNIGDISDAEDLPLSKNARFNRPNLDITDVDVGNLQSSNSSSEVDQSKPKLDLDDEENKNA